LQIMWTLFYPEFFASVHAEVSYSEDIAQCDNIVSYYVKNVNIKPSARDQIL
jgi:hypothetical protein